jgi:plastocyanin
MKNFTKYIFTLLFIVGQAFTTQAQVLFFSEYAEGSSNNKYFEVYNPTSDTVDLSNYAYPNVSNAPTTPGVYEYWNDFDAGAVVLPNDVYVVAHGSADASILAEADETFTYLSNGDDGFGLIYGDATSYVVIDWLGNWDGDPGSGWDVAGVTNGTQDHTLVRKCDVISGDTSWTNAAGTDSLNSQWTVYPQNTWTYLGSHVSPCNFVYGCTDSTALNYDTLATVDDGSCLYLSGCTDPNALNYDSLATVDDGSCLYTVYGCTDSTATNYDLLAMVDDGSCFYFSVDLSLQGIIDFTVPSGGVAGKAIHLLATDSITDLSVYGIGVANNGGGTDSVEYVFPAMSVNTGESILLCRDSSAMASYFDACFTEFDHVITASGAISQNGDDAIELFKIISSSSLPVSHNINAGNFYFTPSALTINAGDTVVWLNNGGFHNVNFVNSTITGLSFNNPESFITAPTSGPILDLHVFNISGSYNYDCAVGSHASNGMVGSLNVINNTTYASVVIETFGDINVNGSGTAWDYLDSWAYKDASGSVTFSGGNWIFGGVNCTDGSTTTYASSCPYPLCPTPSNSGCTDSTALNYDPLATIDDGTCNYTLQPMVNLFFSEYAEGSSHNKYFEVYNPTSDTVDLSNYAYPSVANAPSTPGTYEYWNDFDAGAVILPNDVYVVAHPSADTTILAQADETHMYLSNGDDGYGLIYGDTSAFTVIDWLGNWDGDPGSGWEVAGIPNATKDHTLVRKCDVISGDTSWTNAAGTDSLNSQWIVYPQNTWTYLGSHISPCNTGVPGCTDSLALNYDSLATVDDGSCLYCVYGCMDVLACNYDSLATCDDGGCLTTYGCTDSTALNYDALATCDDGSCVPYIYGCTDPGAINYYSGANSDDGSCIYAGCTDSNASNYDSNATIDDGSCTYWSCADPAPSGLGVNWSTDTKSEVTWDNMNDSSCMVWKYYVRYRAVGDPSWTTKSAGVGNGLCNFGLNTTTKVLQNLTSSTTYDFKMKAFYCGGGESGYSSPSQFTTAGDCPEMTNVTVQTFNSNHAKARFDWDTTGAYVFARIALRVDTAGASWETAGGFGVYWPTTHVNKFGLQSGESYRAQGRTFCDSNITSYRSWWTTPVFWTQPGSIRMSGGTTITNLNVYPNPTDDIFNVSFVSEEIQTLSVRVLNIVGEVVYTEALEQFVGEYTKQISIGNNSRGVYFLEITDNDGIINKKIILQ